MRFIVMHKTDARWEAGQRPSLELIAKVGALISDAASTGAFQGGEGLRPSSQGVRLAFAPNGERTVTPGPFTGANELPAGFSIIRASSLDAAVEWATEQAAILGATEVDVRPVTEPWDLGMVPEPAEIKSRRYMALRKATPATESGAEPTPAQRSALTTLIAKTRGNGVEHLASETLAPSRRGRRLIDSRNGVTMFDGPFLETKELVGGFMIMTAASIDEVEAVAERYIRMVEAPELDIRELADL